MVPLATGAPGPTDDCPVCLGHIEAVTTLPCAHRFCTPCVQTFSAIRSLCPVCRTPFERHAIMPEPSEPPAASSRAGHFEVTISPATMLGWAPGLSYVTDTTTPQSTLTHPFQALRQRARSITEAQRTPAVDHYTALMRQQAQTRRLCCRCVNAYESFFHGARPPLCNPTELDAACYDTSPVFCAVCRPIVQRWHLLAAMSAGSDVTERLGIGDAAPVASLLRAGMGMLFPGLRLLG